MRNLQKKTNCNLRLLAGLLAITLLLLTTACGLEKKQYPNIFTQPGVLMQIMKDFQELPELQGHEIQAFQDMRFSYNPTAGSIITVNILRPGVKTQVMHYQYVFGKWEEPQVVTIQGEGSLKDNVISLRKVNFDVLPDIYKQLCEQAKGVQDGEAQQFAQLFLLIDKHSQQWEMRIATKKDEYAVIYDDKGKLVNTWAQE